MAANTARLAFIVVGNLAEDSLRGSGELLKVREEVPMFKQLVVLSSLAAGIGAAATAMYLEANPLAFTQQPKIDLERYLYSDMPKVHAAKSAEQVAAQRASMRAPTPSVDEADTSRAKPNEGSEEPAILELPPVVVTRSSHGITWQLMPPTESKTPQVDEISTPSDASTPPSAPRSLKPCSRYRELGPTHVNEGVPTGSRSVRDLC